MTLHTQLAVLLPLALLLPVVTSSRPPTLVKQPDRSVYYTPGTHIYLACEAEGDPKPEYTWWRNGEKYSPTGEDTVQLSYTGTLIFYKPQWKDEGDYQCWASNSHGTAVTHYVSLREARLKVLTVSPDQTHTPKTGYSYTLPCVAFDIAPSAEISWVIQNSDGRMSPLSLDDRVMVGGDDSLRFANVKSEDLGDYQCVAANSVLGTTSRGPVHSLRPVENHVYTSVELLWADQSSQLGLEGDNLTLRCLFSGYPTPNVTWSRGDESMTSWKVISHGHKLIIADVKPEDACSYQCRGDNAVTSVGVTRSFSVTVESRPVFVRKPRDLDLDSCDSARFDCSARGNPQPDVTFYVNGVLYDASRHAPHLVRGRNFDSLYLEEVKATDSFVVQCNASNRNGYVFANAYLNPPSDVLGEPCGKTSSVWTVRGYVVEVMLGLSLVAGCLILHF